MSHRLEGSHHIPGAKYSTIDAWMDPKRDVFHIKAWLDGEGDEGSVKWLIDGLHLVSVLRHWDSGNVREMFFKIVSRVLEAGGDLPDLMRVLRQVDLRLQQSDRIIQQHSQHMQNQMAQALYSGSQQQQMNMLGGGLGLGGGNQRQAAAAQQFQGQSLAALSGQAFPQPRPPQKITGEIIAYRGWMLYWEARPDETLVHVTPVLRSLHRECDWHGPVLRADHPPDLNNQCGVYALSTNHDSDNQQQFIRYVAVGDVWGEVALSGIVVEGERGYRAEVATIRRLWLSGNAHPVRVPGSVLQKLLAERYACEVGICVPRIENARSFYRQASMPRDPNWRPPPPFTFTP